LLRKGHKNPHAGKKKAVGINLILAVPDYFKAPAGPVYPELGEGPPSPEVDRSISSRLRQEAQETHHEVVA
jgi:hypothetical protein